MTTKTRPDETTDWAAGTVGEDVMTVHKLRGPLNDDRRTKELKSVCGAGKARDEKTVWARAVNCPRCLSAS
ncbi:hypothetical protein [Streptomyces sp. H27-C3]|uniref:hypothetical protein n=1 Tax=Streptomyces sp. H27-C3 TaxID=3046305 RepID=UPI0024BB4F8E|nr:hypothetical protein [Streptomyces sp. H27-C3]MDJ0461981.1 hypothetical protein [Streptomyces sp. H27-C3]